MLPDPNSLYGPLDPAPDAGYVDAPPRMGFFTDTSVCIGCKACEVACKEWNGVPDDGLDLLGMSYDNTGALTANSWRHVAFIEQPRRPGVAAAPVASGADRRPCRPATGRSSSACRADPAPGATARRERDRLPLADDVGRLQALHPRGLPGRLPDRFAVPHRVRHRGGAGGHLQRLRLLHPGLPVRGDRPAQGRRPGVEVHAVLRPDRRGHDPGLRAGVPDRVDPVRRRSTSCGERAADAGGDAARAGRAPRRGCTGTTRTTASAATARSSCCSTSRRCTACRRTRS